MKLSPTLSAYLARTYAVNLLLLLAAMLAALYLFDSVEILRRASKKTDVPLLLALEIALLKLPKEGQTLLPFSVLYSAMFTFWQLTRRYELVVARSAGFSFWQFLAPIVGVAALAGALQMTVINPVSSFLVSNYERMESKYLENSRRAEVALFSEGLWLRQGTEDGGYVIVHAPKVKQAGWTLQQPMALFFSADDAFLRRTDAATATLEPGRWVFANAVTHGADGKVIPDGGELPTTLTPLDVEDSFSSPASMSFWRLPSHIQTLEETGFDSSRLRVYYQNLLAQPLMFAAMVLLAAAVSLRPPRAGGALALLIAGVFLGFVVFFMSSFLQALGSSRQIPVVMAAWSPAVVSFLFGLSAMMNFEDG